MITPARLNEPDGDRVLQEIARAYASIAPHRKDGAAVMAAGIADVSEIGRGLLAPHAQSGSLAPLASDLPSLATPKGTHLHHADPGREGGDEPLARLGRAHLRDEARGGAITPAQ